MYTHPVKLSLSLKDSALALLIVTLWGFHFAIIRLGASEIPPLTLLSVRFSLALLVFAPFAGRLNAEQFKAVAVYAFFYLVLHLGTVFVGLKYVGAGLASMIIQAEIPFLIVLSWYFFGERFGLKTGLGLLVALVGVGIILYQPLDDDFSYFGASLILCSALFWAVGALRMRFIKNTGFAAMTFYSHAVALPFVALLSAVFEKDHMEALRHADPLKVGFVLFYQVVLMSFCLYLWKGLMQRNNAHEVGCFNLLLPFFAVLGGYALLGETLTTQEIVGGLIAFGGVSIVTLRKLQKAKSS